MAGQAIQCLPAPFAIILETDAGSLASRAGNVV